MCAYSKELVKNLKLADSKVLLVLESQNKNVFLSARNVENAKVITARDLNTYAVLNNKALVLTESSVAVLNQF